MVEQISLERNVVFRFNRRIASIVLTEPVPFFCTSGWAGGASILIDEFPDASVLRGTTYLPLVENSVAWRWAMPGDIPVARRDGWVACAEGNTDALVGLGDGDARTAALRLGFSGKW
jgi:hypothetical protein